MGRGFVYLASASPRRRELLRQIGVDCMTLPAEIDEQRLGTEPALAYVARLAAAKAAAVWQRVGDRPRPVLAADTAVAVGDEIFGKPQDTADAMAMLEALSGRVHRVHTAVVVRCVDGEQALVNTSEVRFRATTEAERSAYCATGEPFDKAGGYAIQGLGAIFVEHLSGSYSSVMGLPLFETAMLLRHCGIPAWVAPLQEPA